MPRFYCILVPNIFYAATLERRQSMDLYLPREEEAPLPLIVNIHGGAWKTGDKGPLDAEAFFVEHGYAYLRTNYRYSTQAPHPAQLEDLHSALQWIAEHAGEYNIDTDRVYTIGHSAGGHLASMLALMPWDNRALEIRAVVNQAGPTDLPYILQAKETLADYNPDEPSAIDLLLGCNATENIEIARAASPIAYVHSPAVPHLVIMGEIDEVVPSEHGRRFCASMQESGADCELVILPEAGHVHPSFWQRENFQRILDFYNAHA